MELAEREQFVRVCLVAFLLLAGCGLTVNQKATVLDLTAEALSAGSEAGPIREASMPAGVAMNVASLILKLVAQYLRDKNKGA